VTVAIPPIKILAKTAPSNNFMQRQAGRAGSHYAPANLSSTSVKIPKIEIPNSFCSTGWARGIDTVMSVSFRPALDDSVSEDTDGTFIVELKRPCG
jgi:hypothetical protein